MEIIQIYLGEKNSRIKHKIQFGKEFKTMVTKKTATRKPAKKKPHFKNGIVEAL